jgi:hypothetical protein
VVGVSRIARQTDGIDWIGADVTSPGINLPKSEIVYCATDARISVMAIKSIMQCNPKRLVLFSTTGVVSKIDSSDDAERAAISKIAEAERTTISACEESKVEWTILRRPLIYLEGRDQSNTKIADLIRRIGFMPLYGTASGLRQPVHAADAPRGAIAAAMSSKAANQVSQSFRKSLPPSPFPSRTPSLAPQCPSCRTRTGPDPGEVEHGKTGECLASRAGWPLRYSDEGIKANLWDERAVRPYRCPVGIGDHPVSTILRLRPAALRSWEICVGDSADRIRMRRR